MASSPLVAIILSIAAYSCVQSIFGMGILVFGTPTLLLLGVEFSDALCYLLPSSMVISGMQIVRPGIPRPAIPRHLFQFCLPAIAVFLWLSVSSRLAEHAVILVGLILLLSAFVRFMPPARAFLARFIRRNSAAYHFVMGGVHGLTNLGGAMLAVLAANLHEGKEAVRYTVAFYYLAFGILQCAVLLATGAGGLLFTGMAIAPVAMLVYIAVEMSIFKRIRDAEFEHAMSAFILTYGIILLAQPFI